MKAGWIGTGVMGGPMCGHLLEAGIEVTVFNRTKAKADKLLANGARWAESPKQAAQDKDVVFTMVSYPDDVRNVYLGVNGVLESMKEGSVVVDHTTSKPSLAEEIYKKACLRNISAIDAPVSGGDSGARNGCLSIMAGGDKKAFDRVFDLLCRMGENINYMGGAGKGQHTKMANQIHIACTMVSAVESLLYAYRARLDLKDVIKAIGSGAAGSWTINNLGPRIIERNFDPGFYIEHFIKDMGIALEESRKMNISLPGLAMANQFYISASAMGHGKLGTQALMLVLERINDMKCSGSFEV